MKIEKIWEKNLNCQLFDIKLGDINNNGKFEIVVSSEDGKIFIISHNGKIIHDLFISEEKPIWNIFLYDITQDGKSEIISGGMDGLLNVFFLNNSEIKLLWSQSFQSSVSGFFFEDINNDLQSELIAYGLDKSIRVLNPKNGDLMWGQLFEGGVGIVKAYDCDGDGQIELIGGGNDGTIRVFNGRNGVLKWFKKFPKNVRCVSCFPNNQIIICGGDDKEIYFLDGIKGEIIKSIPMEEFIWKSTSFLNRKNKYKALIYSYSFDFLDPNFIKNNIKYKSKLLCVNNALEIEWDLKGFNIEDLKIIKSNLYHIILGTTTGKLIILDEMNGVISDEINLNSSPSKIEIVDNILYCITKEGKIIVFSLKDS